MNKSDCCNAEVGQNIYHDYYCEKCGKYQHILKYKPKVTKYYQVTYWKRKNERREYFNDIVIADNPVRAMETVTSGIGCNFEGIKLIEIIQEDNQE